MVMSDSVKLPNSLNPLELCSHRFRSWLHWLRGINKDPNVWIDGAAPHPNYVLKDNGVQRSQKFKELSPYDKNGGYSWQAEKNSLTRFQLNRLLSLPRLLLRCLWTFGEAGAKSIFASPKVHRHFSNNLGGDNCLFSWKNVNEFLSACQLLP
jgi:hypothetical protein